MTDAVVYHFEGTQHRGTAPEIAAMLTERPTVELILGVVRHPLVGVGLLGIVHDHGGSWQTICDRVQALYDAGQVESRRGALTAIAQVIAFDDSDQERLAGRQRWLQQQWDVLDPTEEPAAEGEHAP